MSKELITGYIDDTARYCPYCGEKVKTSGCEKYKCNNCEQQFYVVEDTPEVTITKAIEFAE